MHNNVYLKAIIGKAAEMPTVQSFRPKATNHMDVINSSPLPSIFDEKKNADEFDGAVDAEADEDVAKNIDIGDLTWNDKERVLRLLFAKMNGVAYSSVKQEEEESESEEESEYGSEIAVTAPFDTRFASIGALEAQGNHSAGLDSASVSVA